MFSVKEGVKSEKKILEKRVVHDLGSVPVVKTPCFPCRGHRFDPWSGN